MNGQREREITAIAWRCAKTGLWLASDADGRPAGIVSDTCGCGFSVTTASGQDLGRHSTLESAKSILERSVA